MTAQKSKNKDLKPKSGYMTNEVLRAIFESINVDALFMLDKTGRIVSWNPSAERLTGYSHEEILLKNYSIFFPKNEREKVKGR